MANATDHAFTPRISDEAVQPKTGKRWSERSAVLDHGDALLKPRRRLEA